ncbi:TetR/AcrR family transcriptional regulator [Glutamicibacter halophytocola]|uniref:TetR/AcrR family transcriptional regulator n=1 Tax=Glutamicibacter halophytocola TaxID=1933880 RepID=A0ABX5YBT9_9MICC|nr:TetR/AcrR family transcriptional regulator [Glutamicibacter halophytocola]NQD41062.1 TetR/AcrR family transcriptional regulator [Glutamicibacter halophytocola]QDY67131.1 TetR/AcrR family transcriptional regulator [Glutamicibacter halophytocola]
MSPRITARTKLLDAAAQLFYADGISATGIDAVIAKAGVAKMSLYNNFESKTGLVLAYLQARHQEWLELYQRRLEMAGAGAGGVLAVVDAYIDHAEAGYEHGFRGCGLLNAAAELPAGDPGRAIVAAHKTQVEQLLAGHLETLTAKKQAALLAGQISFLLEGAISRAGLEGNSALLLRARSMISDMVEAL